MFSFSSSHSFYCMFSGFVSTSWSTMAKGETLMRRRWRWPAFGWRYVSASLTNYATFWAVDIKLCLYVLFFFRKRIWSQSFSRSSLLGLRLSQMATHGWHESPTDRTWIEPRWLSWSTKAILSRRFILWKRRMNWRWSTSCSKATERRGRSG